MFLVTLLLLSCSISWCQSSTDSVLIHIDALRTANAKMIELEYEKEINNELRNVLITDSTLIDALQTNLDACENGCQDKINEVKKQRNIAIGAGSGASAFLLILLIILAL